MTAPEPSPGQAAYEAWHPVDCDCGFSWANLGERGRRTWERVAQQAVAAQERPAPEQAETDRERTERLHLAGERDEARSDYSRLRAALLEGGQSDAAVRKRCLAIIATAGTLPAAAQERPAPELAAAMAETRRLRDVVCDLLDLYDPPDSRLMQHSSVTRGTLQRYAKKAGIRLDGLEPQPAPGTGSPWQLLDEARALLAVTEAERNDLRQALDERNRQLDAFTHVVHDVTDSPVLAGTADAVREQAGMTSIDQFSKPTQPEEP